MKQRDLLLAGLLLLGGSVFAQNAPDLTNPNSAKQVFFQGFEDDWNTWSTTEVDRITQLEYWDKSGTDENSTMKPWDDGWTKISQKRDSLMILYNGVVIIDDAEKKKSIKNAKGDVNKIELWGEESYDPATIIEENDPNSKRAQDLALFGEDGQSHYFKFTSDTIKTKPDNTQSYTNNLSARYRRNLFVRLKPGDIEENSSYRLTFYVKAKKIDGHSDPVTGIPYNSKPTIYADVMRGYFHNDVAFSMGYLDNNKDTNPYGYTDKFEYTKNDFFADGDWDNWEKVTFMTYYTTDSIADYFVFKSGYWWAGDSSWIWTKDKNPTKDKAEPYDLNYIVQPDKFFVRLGFASDYTEFSIDNMSLTKSWIGGCEYYQDKMRVDFGYKTNLGDLVAEEYARSGIKQLALPEENFTVWAQKKSDDSWVKMPLRYGEYHGDGYLYLFTKIVNDVPLTFDTNIYKKFLVEFKNPTDNPKLALKYTDRPFPMGNNASWIKKGKYVPDFVNEIAVPNPTASIWKGVYSIDDLPPVVVEGYEDGEFGLPATSSIKYKFQRKVILNDPNVERRLQATVDGVVWNVAYDGNDQTTLVISNPSGQKIAEGDHLIKIVNVYGEGTERGDDVKRNFNVSTMKRELPVLTEVWDANFSDVENEKGKQPKGTGAFYRGANWSVGDGTNTNASVELYRYTSSNPAHAALCELDADNSQSNTAHLYLGYSDGYKINLTPGNYSVNFDVTGLRNNKWIKVYVYKHAAQPYNVLSGNKMDLGQVTTTNYVSGTVAGTDNIAAIEQKLQAVSFGFTIEETADYIVEIETQGALSGWEQYTGTTGVLFSNVTILQSPLPYAPIKSLNAAVDNAKTRIEQIKDNLDMYGGTLYERVRQLVKYYDYDPEGDFSKSYNNNYPTKISLWNQGINDLNDLSIKMVQRKDTIDALIKKIEDANNKLSTLDGDYLALAAVEKLQAKLDSAGSSYNVPDSSGENIDEFTKRIDAAITAIDDRVKVMDALKDAITEADKAIANAISTDIPEYKDLNDTLAEANQVNLITAKDAALTAETEKLTRATVRLTSLTELLNAETARLKGLRKLSRDYGADEVNFWALNNFVDTATTDNDEIAEIYKVAIKKKVYELAATDPTVFDGGTEFTPFIKNYNLLATINGPIKDWTKYKLATGDDRKQADLKAKNNPGSTIMKIQHNYGKDYVGKNCWVLMYDSAYADVFPGWTVESFVVNEFDSERSNKHSVVTPDPSATEGATFQYKYLSSGLTRFDGALSLDWGSKAELKGALEGLPAGLYALGVRLNNIDANAAESKTILTTTVSDENGDPFVQFKEQTTDGTGVDLFVDSIVVLDGKMSIELLLQSNDGRSQADNFFLEYISPLDETQYDVSYADSIDVLEEKLDNMIKTRKTLVNTPKAAAASVEYYTVGGQKLVAPRRGEIIIRKTTQSNGKVVVEKVILK